MYGGQEISRLEKSLPDPEDRVLNLYETLWTKLNNYFSPKKFKHYCRYMFLNTFTAKRDCSRIYRSLPNSTTVEAQLIAVYFKRL